MASIITKTELSAFLNATSSDPHSFLGMHPCKRGKKTGLVVRAFLQGAKTCEVVDLTDEKRPLFALKKTAEEGFFEGFIAGDEKPYAYRLRVETNSMEIRQFFDPYSFLPTIGDQDLYLFNEGNEQRLYTKLGARVKEVGGIPGVAFAVWAPSAKRVSVVGNFNYWDGRYHPMRSLGESGVWEIFVPGLKQGELYKFEILTASSSILLKTDPLGNYFEPAPNNAAIVFNDGDYEWKDSEWLGARNHKKSIDEPLSVYELHLGSWKRVVEDNDRPLTYREVAPLLADYVMEMGFTHVELMPIAEHPFAGSWGYQVTGFFAPTQRFGNPDDFKFFVDYMHQRGIGVILDWVPAHFPRDSFALAQFDGSHLFEHEDPRQGAHQDWGTLIFNFGRNEVRCFLIANALFWFEQFHIDGLRVDAVASMLYLDYSRKEGEWIPNKHGGRENLEAIDFLRQVNDAVHENYPGALMIAEESTSWGGVTNPTSEGGLGFDLKWNMGWMHDTLRYFSRESVHRRWHHDDLTFGMLYQYAEKFISPFSHDEVTHGKSSMLFKMGASSIPEKAQNLRSLYTYMWAYPGKKTLFMGSEFGQSKEWNHDVSLDWHLLEYVDHEGIRCLVRDLNVLYRSEPAFYAYDFNKESFEWINSNDSERSVLSFLRMDPSSDSCFAVVGHFAADTKTGYRLGLPYSGVWTELINSNSGNYGGSNFGNKGKIEAEDVPFDGYDYSAVISLPPLSTTIFKREKPTP
ncbi:MAG: 1,4-alpha-glucan branching protein GlgB [Opitutaceae bacterium]|nr:1,4-alpha-glucan branching protein GlgB [Opitutaceae bacterium]